jgi:hypothetical protein
MRYSVYNPSTGRYKVYESDTAPVPPTTALIPGQQSNLGATPKTILPTLPPGARYLGNSETAEGMIVRDTFMFGQFLMFIAAGVIGRWIYDRFFS